MKKEERKVTIKDVARHAGVALGTVDRVLNSTGFVSDKKREQVLKAVKELNYVPNKVARALCKQKEIYIAVVYPDVEKYFWEQINSGIRKAEKQYEAYGMKVIRGYVKSYDVEEQIKVVERLIEKNNIHGLAFVPVHPTKLSSYIDDLVDRGIPVVTFDSDAPRSRRLCFIGEDNVKGGQIAGKLMALFLGGRGKVAVLRAQRDLLAIQQRISGFVEKITNEFSDIEIAGFYDIYDNMADYERNIYEIVERILTSGSVKVDGIFVTNALVDTTGRALEEMGGAGRVKLIGFDYSDETGKLIEKEVISATISTDLESEGYGAVKSLYEYITEKRTPERELIFTKYEIKMKETL